MALKEVMHFAFLIYSSVTLASCGESELYLYSPTATSSDLNITVSQVSGGLWTATYEEGPRNPNDILPLGKTIALRFSPNEGGHTLFVPELGVKLPGLAGQTSQAWIAVRKPVEVKVRCEDHPEENTGLTLRFQ